MKPFVYISLIFALSLLWSEGLEAQIETQRPFITKWDTGSPGVSCSTCITIGTHPDEEYSYDVDWNFDGIYDDLNVTGDITHDYGVDGIVTVAIRGKFPRMHFADDIYSTDYLSDHDKIRLIYQWGDIEWSSMEDAFANCTYLFHGTVDVPDLSRVTSLRRMFYYCTNFNGDLNDWDVSNIEDMSFLFCGASIFNRNLSNWDVSNVTNMEKMFGGGYGSHDFNQDISGWDVSNVTNMAGMFSCGIDKHHFNQDIGEWDVSNVKTTKFMFAYATDFNQDISGWDVSNVKDMSGMFIAARSFNQDISGWDVSHVENMSYMFEKAEVFNQDLESWEVSNVTNMERMFRGAFAFNSDVSSWDVSKVENITDMFSFAYEFNQYLGDWNLMSVKKLSGSKGLFNSTNISCRNYTNTLKGWAYADSTPDSLDLSGITMVYDADAIDARNILVYEKGWSILDDRFVPDCSNITNTKDLQEDEFLVFPTVFEDQLTIESKSSQLVQIYNSAGQLLKTLDVSSGQSIHHIGTELLSGMYFIITEQGKAVRVIRR